MQHPVVSREKWLAARKALLEKEKQENRLKDEVNEARQALPLAKVEKDYVFDTRAGRQNLADLFAGRSQLVVYHFMMGPEWPEGCPRCSFICDHIGNTLPHLNNHGVTWTAVSRAPLAAIDAYKARMGWDFPWASSLGSDFNYDFHVSFTAEERASGATDYNYRRLPMNRDELSGLSSFYKDQSGQVFHVYSTYARGLEPMIGTLMLLDRTALGRNETNSLSFIRRRDEYPAAP